MEYSEFYNNILNPAYSSVRIEDAENPESSSNQTFEIMRVGYESGNILAYGLILNNKTFFCSIDKKGLFTFIGAEKIDYTGIVTNPKNIVTFF